MTIGKPAPDIAPFYVSVILFLASLSAGIYFDRWFWVALPFAGLFIYASWQKWEVLLFLLILSIPWSAEFSFSGNLGTDIPDEPLMIGLTGMVLALLIWKRGATDRMSKSHALIWIYLLGLIWLTVSLFFSSFFWVSFKLWLTKTWYTGAFLLAPLIYFHSKQNIRKLAIWLLVSVLLCTAVVFVRHAVLGFSFININKAVSPFFRNHVNYSSLLVCVVPILGASISLSRRYRFFLYLLMLFILVALFLTYARGAWLALLTGALAVWLIRWRVLFPVYLIFLGLFAGTFLWLRAGDRYIQFAHDYQTTIFHTDFREHLLATYHLKDISTAERFNRWVAALHMAEEKPLAGFGPATYYFRYKPYTSPAFRTWVSDNPEHSTVHNYFLLVLVEQGIPGLIFFMVLSAAMLFYVSRLFHRTTDRFYRVSLLATGSMLVMILTLNFLSDLMETDKVGSLFLLTLAMLVAIDRNTRKEGSQATAHIQGIA